MPPLRTGLLSFGLVSIPVTLHTATKSEHVSFNLLHAKCGSRVHNRWFCPVCNAAVERDQLIRGYEFSKGEYVQFTEDRAGEPRGRVQQQHRPEGIHPDLDHRPGLLRHGALPRRRAQAGRNPISYWPRLWPRASAAVAQLVSRGKEELVLIRPYKNGLIKHSLYYANEVRDFGQIPKGENVKLSDAELTLGTNLIEQMSEEEFKPENYKDEYRIRVLAMLDEKAKGQEITPTLAPERRGQVIDLMQALKQSLEKSRPKKKAAAGQKKREQA